MPCLCCFRSNCEIFEKEAESGTEKGVGLRRREVPKTRADGNLYFANGVEIFV
jgi:hypothetical protein